MIYYTCARQSSAHRYPLFSTIESEGGADMSADQLTQVARSQELPGGPERAAYSVNEIAARWGMEHMGIYKMIRRGDLPAFRIGRYGEYRILRETVEAIENSGR